MSPAAMPGAPGVSLAIEHDVVRGDAVSFRLSGDLVGPASDEVAALWRAARAAGARVVIDITDLRTIDRRGAALVHAICARGDLVVNASPSIARLLVSYLRAVPASALHD